MARRAQPLTPAVWGGVLAALAVPALILLAMVALLTTAGPLRLPGAAEWSAIRFTVFQAALSSVFSVVLAIPVARALARRKFPGRGFLVTLLGAPFLLPVIVAVFGLLAVFGRGGLLNAALGSLGFAPVSVYGLHGVVLAHVFFNMPLATRLILQGWADIPSERFRLAASLGMNAAAINRHLEWPMLKSVLPGAALLIFVICTTSFAVALILGGGPRATTVELAIYQAIRFEFDLAGAAFLSLIQMAITGTAAVLAMRYSTIATFGSSFDRRLYRWDAQHPVLRLYDVLSIVGASMFLILPMLMVAGRGLPWILTLPSTVWVSAVTSICVAVATTLLVLLSAILISLAVTGIGGQAKFLEAAALLAVSASPLVIGAGFFLIIFPFADPSRFALPVTVLVNALLTLPFVLRSILPAIQSVEATYGHLADSLNITGWARLRVLVFPRIRRALGFGAGIAAALSMGDLGVIALFADPDTATLPLQIFRLMGAYRLDDAAGATLLLLAMTFTIFYVFDRGLGRNADS